VREQVRQMQVDKIVLEAKLKESLAAQPAITIPELAKPKSESKTSRKRMRCLKSI